MPISPRHSPRVIGSVRASASPRMQACRQGAVVKRVGGLNSKLSAPKKLCAVNGMGENSALDAREDMINLAQNLGKIRSGFFALLRP